MLWRNKTKQTQQALILHYLSHDYEQQQNGNTNKQICFNYLFDTPTFIAKVLSSISSCLCKTFIDEHSSIFLKFLFKLGDATNYCARTILIFLSRQSMTTIYFNRLLKLSLISVQCFHNAIVFQNRLLLLPLFENLFPFLSLTGFAKKL